MCYGGRLVLPILSLAAILVTAVLIGCISDRPAATGPPGVEECRIPANATDGDSTQVLVTIRNFAFQPAEIRVPRGAAVTWVNCELPNIDAHTTTSDEGVWESGFLTPGARFSHTFEEVGRFPYHCVPHPFMTAAVVVE